MSRQIRDVLPELQPCGQILGTGLKKNKQLATICFNPLRSKNHTDLILY